MVITPLLQMGYEVTTPPEIESAVPPPPSDQIVVRLDAQGRTWINRQEIPRASFGTRLSELMEKRSSKVVFFAADGALPYSQVAEFLDLCRSHGAKELGMVFDDL
jgi:biopolymer transport protein TolR